MKITWASLILVNPAVDHRVNVTVGRLQTQPGILQHPIIRHTAGRADVGAGPDTVPQHSESGRHHVLEHVQTGLRLCLPGCSCLLQCVHSMPVLIFAALQTCDGLHMTTVSSLRHDGIATRFGHLLDYYIIISFLKQLVVFLTWWYWWLALISSLHFASYPFLTSAILLWADLSWVWTFLTPSSAHFLLSLMESRNSVILFTSDAIWLLAYHGMSN